MIRRIVGIAHAPDMDAITDPAARAACERRALNFGQSLLVNPQYFPSVESLVSTAAAAAVPK